MLCKNAANQKFNIPDGALTVLETLERAGYEAWLVGGCVRDHLMGKTPKDYDAATSAPAEAVIGIFQDFRVIETGLRHGTVTVISNEMPVEVTTYRVDGSYSDGRHPDSMSFTTDIREDLSRRDFTVNAIAFSPRRGFLDPFGGEEDLRSGIIRCVGEPAKRFEEDALRILRALRFASVLGFEIEENTREAIHKCGSLLGRIAVERITQELFGILCGENVGSVLRNYNDVIAVIIPPISALFGFEQHNPHHDSDVWEHTVRVVEASPPDAALRLAALLHDVGKPQCFTLDESGIGHFYGHAVKSGEIARGIFADNISTDRKTQERVLLLVENHGEELIPERRTVRRRLAKYGEEALRQLIALNRADIAGQSPDFSAEKLARLDMFDALLGEVVKENACTTLRNLNINGGDLIAMGVPEGPAVGRILKRLLSEVCDETLTNSREALEKRAVEIFNATKGV
ncbi:MAG: HD domain-containing protein [Clostridia bacterium]|nr:HD domain-containing protein [Clostridia bacterium]